MNQKNESEGRYLLNSQEINQAFQNPGRAALHALPFLRESGGSEPAKA
jgi:hypothetical protein